MSSAPLNLLKDARSAYLRSAMHQPVQWHQWGSEAFAKALLEDKPVLLDIGAVWCHWCHVMDRESYEDAETARLINEHFIAIKVDRDERPDVDTRYQSAVASISGQGGWPLTAFLTPTGDPYFGGTYFPPVDGHGRPGLRRVLMTMAEAFQNRRGEVMETASSVVAAIEHNESFDGTREDPGAELAGRIVFAAISQFDSRNGGFGAQPKFPNSGAIDLLLDTASRPKVADAKTARHAAMVTLEKMSKGGIYDQLAGGFHRYSVDERWVVPHFEKLIYDNAGLLTNYVHAFQSFADPECARIARETMRWIDEWLSDRVNGGFYTSQDADDSLDDDGDYFTWTREEAAAVLSEEEMAVAAPYFDIGELGDMHHNPAKNVLHIEQPVEKIAAAAGIEVAAARALLAEAKQKLYASRLTRKTPFIDKTVYVGWNAMLISSYVLAGRVLGEPAATSFALKSLDRLLAAAWNAQTTSLGHVVAYGDGGNDGPPVAGVLEDYAFTAHAALDAWEATGRKQYFGVAEAITNSMLWRFHDEARGGFYDIEAPQPGEVRLGALKARRKPLQDSPTPAGNSTAAALLLRLAGLTGRRDLEVKARATLECFGGIVEHFGLYAASYGLALQRLVHEPIQVVIVADGEHGDKLERAALTPYLVNKSVVRLAPRQRAGLPPLLARTIGKLPPQPEGFALVCAGQQCFAPTSSAEELRRILSAIETLPLSK